MNTYTSTSSSNTVPMPPTGDLLKLFMEDIEKNQTLSGKYGKIQAYLDSLKEERSKINDLDLPFSKQSLDHAIKTLDEEHNSVSEKIKNMLNQTGITDVDVMPEEMIRGFLNLSLKPTNTVLHAPEISMQNQQGSLHQGLGQQGLLPQGLGQQGLLPQELLQKMQQQQLQRLLQLMQQQQQQQQGLLEPLQQQVLLQHQQLLMQQQKLLQQQQQGLLQPQIMKPSPLQQQEQGLQLTPQMMQQLQQQALLQQGLQQPQTVKPSQLQQQQGLLEQLGQQVFRQQG